MRARYWEHLESDEHDLLHEIAHGLHFASIAMLGFLVLEVSGRSPRRRTDGVGRVGKVRGPPSSRYKIYK